MKSKFAIAMTIYAVLALIGCIVLDGRVRLMMLIGFGALALKTWIARAAAAHNDRQDL